MKASDWDGGTKTARVAAREKRDGGKTDAQQLHLTHSLTAAAATKARVA